MRRNYILVIIGIVILLLAGGVFFFGHHHRMMIFDFMHGPPGKKKIVRILKWKFDLSDKQLSRLNEIEDRYSEKRRVYKIKLSRFLRIIIERIVENKFNEEEVQKVFKESRPIIEELRDVHLRELFEYYDVLDIEQQKEAREIMVNIITRIQERLDSKE